MRIKSKDFSDIDISKSEFDEIENLYIKASTVASEESKSSMKVNFENYSSTVLGELSTLKINTEKQLNRLKTEFDSKKDTLQNQINELEEAKKNTKDPTKRLFWVLAIIVLVLSVGSLSILGLLALSAMGYGVWRVGCYFLLPSYNKKIKAYDTQIAALKNELEQMYRAYTCETDPLYGLIRKAGNV